MQSVFLFLCFEASKVQCRGSAAAGLHLMDSVRPNTVDEQMRPLLGKKEKMGACATSDFFNIANSFPSYFPRSICYGVIIVILSCFLSFIIPCKVDSSFIFTKYLTLLL